MGRAMFRCLHCDLSHIAFLTFCSMRRIYSFPFPASLSFCTQSNSSSIVTTENFTHPLLHNKKSGYCASSRVIINSFIDKVIAIQTPLFHFLPFPLVSVHARFVRLLARTGKDGAQYIFHFIGSIIFQTLFTLFWLIIFQCSRATGPKFHTNSLARSPSR